MKNLIRFDWAIKRLLRNKANFGILEGLLSELLEEDIKIDHILESESNKQVADNKANRVDLLVQDSKGDLIIIEVQSDYMQNYLLRMLFGTSKLVIDNMDEGMPYRQVKKIISVNIVYFDLGQGEDYIYHGGTNFVGMNRKDILHLSRNEQLVYHTEKIAKIYPEYYIIKVNQFNDVAKNTLDEWINFLKTEEVKEGSKAKGLKEAKEKLNKLKLSPEEKRDYEQYIKNWRDEYGEIVGNYEKGKFEGREEGIGIGMEMGAANKQEFADEKVKQSKIEMALNCLKNGMSIEMIAKLTSLTEEEVRGIKK